MERHSAIQLSITFSTKYRQVHTNDPWMAQPTLLGFLLESADTDYTNLSKR